MADKPKEDAIWRARLRRQMGRPGQGPDTGPYWIVMNLSRHKNPKVLPPNCPFRHPTESAAIAEAERLAESLKGQRFGVFAFTGITAKVEAPSDSVAVEEPAPEVAQAA